MFMKRWTGLLILFVLWINGAKAQSDVLMVINGEKITSAEYKDFCLRKGLPAQAVNVFINYKLKVNAARGIGLDTLETFWSYMDSCRHSLSQEFLIKQKEMTTCQMKDHLTKPDRVLVCHIFQYIPQNVTSYSLRACEARMDSLRSVISLGQISFEEAVQRYSQEKEPFWIEKLEMPVEFEQVAFTLPLGQVSAPFFTPQGIHMVKVLQRASFSMDSQFLEGRYLNNRYVTDVVLDSLKREYHFVPDEVGIKDFLAHGFTVKNLFALDGKVYSGKDMRCFVQSHPASPKCQLNDFIAKSILACAVYRLEDTCSDYRIRLRACSDSLLCQIITDRMFGEHLQTDTVGVANFFEHNRKNYYWPETRFEGVVLHCVSRRVGKKIKKFLKKLPVNEWEDAIRLGVNADKQVAVQVEQGLFAPGENQYVDDVIFKKKESCPIEGFPYTLVLGEKKKGPKFWVEVGNRIWSDYRAYLETCWMKDLWHRAKVEINEEALKTVNIH